MKKINMVYCVLVGVSIIFILYLLVRYYLIELEVIVFFSYKIGLKCELNFLVWLKIMYIYVVFVCLVMVVGLVNFLCFILEKYWKIYWINGYVYVVFVMMVVLIFGYMVLYFIGGKINSIVFNIINIIWLVMIVMVIV